MLSWQELRKEFQACEEALRFVRINYQWGAAGTYFRLAGVPVSPKLREFETLCSLAGVKLSEIQPEELSEAVLGISSPEERWYEALRQYSGLFASGPSATQMNDDGSSAGHIFTGSIHDPAQASMICALRLSEMPVKNPAPKNFFERLENFLSNECKRRPYLWGLVAFAIPTVIALVGLL
ncbi:hypothetical protein [Marinobacter sp.]|uniref:hypothetical protein n=1 Tax=Marinobacter sp. TaxID=50741 RepID=UPI0035C74D55